MKVPYVDYLYLYPPRPERALPETSIQFMEGKGYGAQVKKNGTCTVIFSRGKEVIFKTRHPESNNGEHRAWQPLPEHIKFFQSSSKKWTVFVAELLHSKVPGIRNQLVINDILVFEGEQLVGKTFAERQEILHSQWKGEDEGDQIRVSEYVSIAKTFLKDFKKLWGGLKAEDEGLVFKHMDIPMARCIKASSNTSWQLKIRRPATNYSF